MGFIAEVHLVHDELPLAPTVERHPEVTIRYEYQIGVDDGTLCFVSVFGGEHAALEETLATDRTVSEPARVATFENRAIYRVSVDTDLDIVPDHCAEGGLFVFTIVSAERGWTVRAHLPDRDVLSAYREYCRDRDASFRVKQLCEANGTGDGTYFLTEQQHEILSMAYYAGYYGVPRSVSQDYLADRLEISNSAVSQRLRRAVAELIAATIEDNRMPDAFD